MLTDSLIRATLVPITRRWGKGAHRIGSALGDRVLTGRTPGGSPIALSMGDYQHRAIYFYGAYEPEVTALFHEVVKPGMTVFDIGANAGYFSILSRELGASVHAFEPNPAVRVLLERSVALAPGGIEIVPCACSDRPGTVPLYLSEPGNTGRSGLMVARERSVDVEVITVDEYVARTQAPQFVKIDVEGAEVNVLRGMSDLLREGRPTLLVELHETKGPVAHATNDEVVALLADARYEHEPVGTGSEARPHILAQPRP